MLELHSKSRIIACTMATPRKRRSNVPSLVCAFLASVTTGGTIYAFGIYGDALKKSLNISQMELDAISATFFIAGLFSWMPGLVVDRKGMRFSMCLGGCTGAISTMIYWIIARKFIVVSHVVAVLSLLAVCICLSCGLIVGSIFKLTLLNSSPGTKGSAVGVAKGFVGLGAGVYATIFQALRTEDESALDFLPVIAFFFILCAAFPAWLLLPGKEQIACELLQYDTTPLHFRILYLSLFSLALVILGSSVMEIMNENDTAAGSRQTRDYRKVAFILLIWLGPISSLLFLPKHKEDLPFISQQELSGRGIEDKVSDPSKSQAKNTDEAAEALLDSYQKNSLPAKPEVVDQRPDLSLPQMLQTLSAWLMLWTTTILVGSGTYKTNNMGEMVEALGFPDALTPATLAIFSVAQASSRIITGIASEAALKWNVPSIFCVNYGVPRPFFLVVASAIALFAHLMLAGSTSQISFVIGCTISGIAFGMIFSRNVIRVDVVLYLTKQRSCLSIDVGMAWPLMVLIVGDIFVSALLCFLMRNCLSLTLHSLE